MSKVSDMSYMFWDAASFEGGGLAMWDRSSVRTMSGMFYGASLFNHDYVHGVISFHMTMQMTSSVIQAAHFRMNH